MLRKSLNLDIHIQGVGLTYITVKLHIKNLIENINTLWIVESRFKKKHKDKVITRVATAYIDFFLGILVPRYTKYQGKYRGESKIEIQQYQIDTY